MKNRGLHTYRFLDNPLERVFAEAWDDNNQRGGTLDHLLGNTRGRHYSEVTDRDRQVAATVIQWLGSPVGQYFLKNEITQREV